ncbi:MAG TPA: hypothetical protein VM142_02085 [Acidimicrobiales bacterium]|nr:hypothetical protein [Acidimicrobiales bacterium]
MAGSSAPREPFYRNLSRTFQQISYDEFVQRVRRHRPSELLPAIAAAAIEMRDRELWMRSRVLVPWALGLAAKEAIVSGNEHRPGGVTRKDIVQICEAVAKIRDPLGTSADTGSVASFMTRVSHEQFPFQMSPFEEIARTQALYVDALAAAPTKRLTPALLSSALGSDPTDFAGVGFLLAVGAQLNSGYFDLRWLEQPNFVEICEVLPAELIRAVFKLEFATTAQAVRERVGRVRPPGDLKRHEFNPLRSRPFVEMSDGRHLAPQPAYAFHKLEPNAVYYAVAPRLGPDFTNDLGITFETYIARQLDQLDDVAVVPEIEYEDGRRSVDWFLVFGEVVVFVEAKITRLTESARLGTSTLGQDLDRTIGEAFEQIGRSLGLVQAAHPAFSAIPSDRPHVGLVITLEPYWMANSLQTRSLMTKPPPDIPTLVASSRELEQWIADHPTGGGQVLHEIAIDAERRTWNLGLALPPRPGDRAKNRLLQRAWDRLPWRDALEDRNLSSKDAGV